MGNYLLIKYFFCTFAREFFQYMKSNTQYLRIFNILLAVAAYAYLVYKLITFSDYQIFVQHFRAVSWYEYFFLAVALLLMPLNIFFESVKWRELLLCLEPMTLRQAQKQVYYGFVGAFVTPYRAGDYPARTTMMHDTSKWTSAVGLGLVGSAAMLLVQLALGIPALTLFSSDYLSLPLTRVFMAAALGLLLLLLLPWFFRRLSHREWKHDQLHQLFVSLSSISRPQFLRVCAWSVARYVVWGLQLTAVLLFCGVTLSPIEYFIAIPTYYLVLAFFPTVPIADVAIRGGWAIIIFGAFTINTPALALAVTLIWLINTVLPMLIGTLQPPLNNCKQPLNY